MTFYDDSESTIDPMATHVAVQWKYTSPLINCRFDPSGQYVFATAQDNAVIRWTVADGAMKVFQGHDSWARGIEFSQDGKIVVTSGCDDRLLFWNVADEAESPVPVREIHAHKGWIRSIQLSPNGTFLASGGNDRIVKIWNMEDGELLHEFTGHEKDIYDVMWHPTDGTLFSGDLAGQIRRWNIDTGEVTAVYDGKDLHTYNGGQKASYGGIRGMVLSPDNTTLYACGLHKATNPFGAVQEPLVLAFNLESKELEKKWEVNGLKAIAWRIQYHPQGFLFCVCGGGAGGYLTFIKPGEDKDFHRAKLPNVSRGMDLHPDGVQVCVAHYDNHLRIVRLEAKAEEPKKEG